MFFSGLFVHGSDNVVGLRVFRVDGDYFFAAFGGFLELAEHELFDGLATEGISAMVGSCGSMVVSMAVESSHPEDSFEFVGEGVVGFLRIFNTAHTRINEL